MCATRINNPFILIINADSIYIRVILMDNRCNIISSIDYSTERHFSHFVSLASYAALTSDSTSLTRQFGLICLGFPHLLHIIFA